MADINIKFPTMDEFAKEVAEKALDEFLYDGKSIREWMQIIALEDAISRQAVLNEIPVLWNSNGDKDYCMETLRDFVVDLSSIKPQEQKIDSWSIKDVADTLAKHGLIKEQEPKTGRWIAQDIHNCHTNFKCSECGYIHSFMHLYGKPAADYTYCPNCGARMEGET